MNDLFTWRRFALLLRRQWLEFGRIYLISLAVVAGLLVLFYAFNIDSYSRDIDGQGYYRLSFRQPLFWMLGFLFISIVSSAYFAHLGQKPRALAELMTPASVPEKYLCAIFYTALVSILSFVLLFWAADSAFIAYVTSSANITGKPPGQVIRLSSFFSRYSGPELRIFYLLPFLVTSVFLLGSVYFNRFQYIKTAISLMIFLATWTYLLKKFMEMVAAGKSRLYSPIIHGNEQQSVNAGMVLIILLTLVFWIIGFIRYREKEV